MRIAQIAPLYEAVPPRFYGGTERVVAHLCDALCKAGHEVTLFAAGESRTQARLRAARERALRLDGGPLKSDIAGHFSQLQMVKRQAHRLDIMHFRRFSAAVMAGAYRELYTRLLTREMTDFGAPRTVEAQ